MDGLFNFSLGDAGPSGFFSGHLKPDTVLSSRLISSSRPDGPALGLLPAAPRIMGLDLDMDRCLEMERRDLCVANDRLLLSSVSGRSATLKTGREKRL